MNIKTSILLLTTFILLVVSNSTLSAVNYTISFSGSGATTIVESVIVQNLTKGTTATVSMGKTLTLNNLTSGLVQTNSNSQDLVISQLSNTEKYKISFLTPKAGITTINIYKIDGRSILSYAKSLQAGINDFQLDLPLGIFIIQVTGSEYHYCGKIQHSCGTNSEPKITLDNSSQNRETTPQRTNSTTQETIAMAYSAGDLLLYKGISGKYSTIVTDASSGNKTIDFNFVECADASGNNYTTVKIGSQIWMAENLKTTKYRSNDDIYNQTNNSSWGTSSSGVWCNYNNDTVAGRKYGKLYNWYAVADSRNITPTGWHVPTDNEWSTLMSALGGETVAGAKIKDAGTVYWDSSNNGSNESGFTALPGGYRLTSGSFYYGGSNACWWTATESTSAKSWYRIATSSSSAVNHQNYSKYAGFSVRCIKSSTPTISTSAIGNILSTSATCDASVTDSGGENVTAYGICWSTLTNPTIVNSKTIVGAGVGSFTGPLSGLTPNTTYYVRAYATNSIGTNYGNELTFKTSN